MEAAGVVVDDEDRPATQPREASVTHASASHVDDPDRYVADLRGWLADLSPEPVAPATTADRLASGTRLKARLHDAGWGRVGWPAAAGGLGGGALHRAALYDELSRAGQPQPEQNVILEVVGPPVCRFAPELARRHLPAFLRGDETWCQGFSEPEAGSDLAALRCRATRDGTAWRVDGQKTWTTLGPVADRMVLLARTGTRESRHRGLSMFLVDLDTPGVTVVPIRYANGHDEIAEVFFDDARVPADRMIGDPGQGWAIAMHLLQFERGMYAWMRQAVLHDRLRDLAGLLRVEGSDEHRLRLLGEAHVAVAALRARSAATVARLHRDEPVGPEASADKILLAEAEQQTHEAARRVLGSRFLLDAGAARWRDDWFYARAASVYGGCSEVQRDIVADRVLALPKEGAR